MQVKARMVELKGYIYCFGDIILLLRYLQGEKGVQKFGLFKFTSFMDRPLEQSHQAKAKSQSNDSVKLLTPVDPQII